MDELIQRIEESLGLPCNWKSDLELVKKFSWIEDMEDKDAEIKYLTRRLEDTQTSYYDNEEYYRNEIKNLKEELVIMAKRLEKYEGNNNL